MEDRFKFRVWSTYENECYLAGNELESVLEINRELDGTDHFFVSHRAAIETDYVFEQCTGLKDKHGKLIYEGDIVDWNPNPPGPMQVCSRTIAQICAGYGYWYCLTKTGDFLIDSIIAVRIEEGKIIGNIHEKPELLEESQ